MDVPNILNKNCNLKSMNMMKHDIYYYSYKSSLDQLYAG